MTALQAPVDLSTATRVGGRVYRKQVLAKRTIDYPLPDGSKRTVSFDDEYLTDLAQAFQQGAYDLVPFQLATPGNQHNEDPRNYGGRVIGAEVTPDGLDMILELSEDAAALVEKTGGRLGVSARIKEALEHVDGRTFKRAVRHVLGTLDPRMQNLKPWQPIDLAADPDPDLIDLSGLYTHRETDMPRIIDLSALSDDQQDALASFAALNGIDLADADAEPAEDEPYQDDETDEGEGDEDESTDEPDEGDAEEASDEPEGITDDELEALIDAELAGVELSTPEDDELADELEGGRFADVTDLSDPADADPLDLALATGDTPPARDENAALRFQLAAAELARKGVPPHLIDLAEPVLTLSDEQADTLDLATPDGGHVDVRGIVRDMLEAVAGSIDLSSETGYGHETEPDEKVQTLASAWTEYLENN